MSVVASPRIASIHSTPHLLCDIAPDRDIVAVLAIGELDLATVPALDATLQDLRDAGFTALHLDLRSIGFIAVAGVRLLWRWRRLAEVQGFELRIDAGPAVERTLALIDLARY